VDACSQSIKEGINEMLKTSNFTDIELRNYYYNNEIMFFTKNAVQQLFYSQAQRQFYFLKIATVSNFCQRGRFYAYTPETAEKYMSMYSR
jgi:hypothetical protein